MSMKTKYHHAVAHENTKINQYMLNCIRLYSYLLCYIGRMFLAVDIIFPILVHDKGGCRKVIGRLLPL